MNTTHPVPQHPQQPLPKLTDISPEIATTGFLWLMKNRTRWGLSLADLGKLLGGVSSRTLTRWHRRAEQGDALKLRLDTVERISVLLGIHKTLAQQTPVDRTDLAWTWFQTPTDLFGLGGQSIRGFLLDMGTLGSFYSVRRRLEVWENLKNPMRW